MTDPDVIFIGAGPVGLFTAIQAKLYNPELKIKMFERNQEYTRNHILRVDPTSYRGAYNDPCNEYNNEFQTILGRLKGFVRTTEIEEQLRKFALKIGIDLVIGTKIENIEDLAETYPSVHTIVGSDGARSSVRQQIFSQCGFVVADGLPSKKEYTRLAYSHYILTKEGFFYYDRFKKLLESVVSTPNPPMLQALRAVCPSGRTIPTLTGMQLKQITTITGHVADAKSIDKNTQNIIEVKYETLGIAPHLSTYQMAQWTSQINHFISENVGKTKEGRTPVSLFFFTDKATSNEIRSMGNARNPIKLTSIKAGSHRMTQLANSIHPWLAYRKAHGEVRIEGSEKIAAVALDVYRANGFVTIKHNVRYVLVGDAAMGVPYFRALNAGLLGGSNAARLISHPDSSNTYTSEDFIRDQNTLSNKELSKASLKNLGVFAGQMWAKSAQNVSLKTAYDTMPEQARSAMRQARVSPLSFYRRHSHKLLTATIFGVISAMLIGAWGLGMVPIAVAAAIAVAFTASYKLMTWVIRKIRTYKLEPGDSWSDLRSVLDSSNKKGTYAAQRMHLSPRHDLITPMLDLPDEADRIIKPSQMVPHSNYSERFGLFAPAANNSNITPHIPSHSRKMG